MTQVVLFTVLTFLAFQLITLAYMLSGAVLARWLGVTVQRVTLGMDVFGKRLLTWQGRHWEWRIGLLPIGGSTTFKGNDDRPDGDGKEEGGKEPPPHDPELMTDSFPAASRLSRIALMLVGPTVQIGLGALSLSISVAMQTEQLQYDRSAPESLQPSAIPGLRVGDTPATWNGHRTLCLKLAGEAAWRYVLFQPLDGWGGLGGWLVTGGATGKHSLPMWFSFVGLMALLNGFFNLLPVAGMNGTHFLLIVLESIVGTRAAETWFICYTLITLVLLLIVYARILCADVIWFLGL